MIWLHNLLLATFSFLVKWLVKVNNIPSDIENELGIDKSKPIIYLLGTQWMRKLGLGMDLIRQDFQSR